MPEHFVMYVQDKDKALGISNWLFSGLTRVGDAQSKLFSPAEIHALRTGKFLEVVEARVSDAGAFGHDYFHSNPAVSSDLILLMRYQFQAGADYGRPLGENESGFWLIEDGYPGAQKNKVPEAK